MKIGQFVQHKEVLQSMLPSEYEDKIADLLDEVGRLNKELSLLKETNPQGQMISFADQQLVGYVSAKNGDSVTQLVKAMGLTEQEWGELKSQDVTWIGMDNVQEIDGYFEGE